MRRAAEADTAEILACLRVAFEPYQECYTQDAFLNTVLTPELFRARLLTATVFVAIAQNGALIGTVAAEVMDGAEGHLRGMAVSPDWQGRGVAERLLEAASTELRACRCARVSLDTTEPLRRAVRFYEAQGFQATGRVAQFFGMPLYEYVKRLDKDSRDTA